MREMKDSGVSWIGNIPANWITLPAKHCVSISHGSDPKTTGDIPVYGSGNDIVKTCGEFKKGPCVLIGRKGSIDSPKYIEGRYWNVDTAFDVKPKDSFNLRYYYYQSICFDYKVMIKQTTLPSMTSSQYNNMFIAKPPIDEQQKIVSYLDSKCSQIDEAIRRQESIIGKLKEYRQSVIMEAVTKGLDPNAEMKDSGLDWIGLIPDCYRVGRIKNWYSVTLGKMVSPKKTEDSQTLENYLCAANIQWEGIDLSVQKKMYLTPKEKQTYLLSPGDVLVSEGGSVGTTCMYGGELAPCYIQNSVHRVTSISSEALNRYIYYWFHVVSSSGYLDNICNKATFSHYTKEKVINTPVILPPESVQKEIVSYLDYKCLQIDEAIRRQESIIGKLKAYRQSLIYEVVTGKKEVI